MKAYYVYVATNRSETLYIGVTNNPALRMAEHASGEVPGFTSKYNIDTLIYFEETSDVNQAIAREKQLKGWSREKKINLIESMNPRWQNLLDRSFDAAQDDKVEADQDDKTSAQDKRVKL